MIANLSVIIILTKRVAIFLSKSYNTLAIIEFIKEQFINETDILTALRKLIKSHLTIHVSRFKNGVTY